MVKKFTANCDFGGKIHPVTLYVGTPAKDCHPLGFQSKWLSENRGGMVPPNIMDSFEKLSDIANKNKVPFEDLCAYVIDELKSSKSVVEDSKKATSIANDENKDSSNISSQQTQQDSNQITESETQEQKPKIKKTKKLVKKKVISGQKSSNQAQASTDKPILKKKKIAATSNQQKNPVSATIKKDENNET